MAGIHYGDIGRAFTAMSPSGVVEVNGERIDARSEWGFVAAGRPVIVLRGDPTGYVVREVEPGREPPKLENHGQPILKAEFQWNSAEVAEAEQHASARAEERRIERLREGSRLATGLGAGAGLLSGTAGWTFGWAGQVGPEVVGALLVGSAVVGAALGVACFFAAGLVGPRVSLEPRGHGSLVPEYGATLAALFGAAAAFWWQFGGQDVGAILVATAGGAALSAVLAYAVGWMAIGVLGVTGEG